MKPPRRKAKILSPEEQEFKRGVMARLREALGPHGMKGAVAKRGGVSRNTVTNWEKKKGYPSLWELLGLEKDTSHRASYVAFGELPKHAPESHAVSSGSVRAIQEDAPTYGDSLAFIRSAIECNDGMKEVLTLCLAQRAKDAKLSAALDELHERGAAELQRQRLALEKIRQRIEQAQEALSGRRPAADGENEDV